VGEEVSDYRIVEYTGFQTIAQQLIGREFAMCKGPRFVIDEIASFVSEYDYAAKIIYKCKVLGADFEE